MLRRGRACSVEARWVKTRLTKSCSFHTDIWHLYTLSSPFPSILSYPPINERPVGLDRCWEYDGQRVQIIFTFCWSVREIVGEMEITSKERCRARCLSGSSAEGIFGTWLIWAAGFCPRVCKPWFSNRGWWFPTAEVVNRGCQEVKTR